MSGMQAVGFSEFGGPETLGLVSLPVPVPGPGEVRVRVAAAAVNPTDLAFRSGGHRSMPDGMSPPYVPGMDLAGVVDVAGADAAGQWASGDRVMAAVSPWAPGGGAQAEFVVVAADALARVPGQISLEAAATLPMNALTVRAALDEAERGITVSLVLVFRHLHEGGTLARLAELADKGVLSLRVADVLAAARAAEAHRRFEAHGVRGRLVLTF
jgi:NADPH2:quinone reductase